MPSQLLLPSPAASVMRMSCSCGSTGSGWLVAVMLADASPVIHRRIALCTCGTKTMAQRSGRELPMYGGVLVCAAGDGMRSGQETASQHAEPAQACADIPPQHVLIPHHSMC